jgi:biopolymer transport protein ExbD
MSAHQIERADPNLTPLLDMVFQLITFFMLVINFKGASLDLSLKLPVLGSARPLEKQGKFESILLNIDSEGNVKADGQQVDDIDQYIEKQAHYLKARLKALEVPITEAGLPVHVVIRADRTAPFHLVNRILKTCQDHGYRQFALSAMSHEEKSP